LGRWRQRISMFTPSCRCRPASWSIPWGRGAFWRWAGWWAAWAACCSVLLRRLELALIGRTLIGLGVSVTFHCHAEAGCCLVRGKSFRHHRRHLHADRQSGLGPGRRAALRAGSGNRLARCVHRCRRLVAGARPALLVDRTRFAECRRFTRHRFDRTVVLSSLLSVLTQPGDLAGRHRQYRHLRCLFYLCRFVGDALSGPGAWHGALGRRLASVAVVRRFCHRLPVHRRLSDRLGRRKPVMIATRMFMC
jgi:hypothetical protein